MQRLFLFLLLICSTLLGCLADLPKKSGFEIFDFPKNRLEGATKLHLTSAKVGAHFFDSLSYYSFSMSDEFFGLIGRAVNPYPETISRMDVWMNPNALQSNMYFPEFQNGKMLWRFNNGQTAQCKDSSDCEQWDDKADKDLQFWMPTLQYFIEFLNRIQDADQKLYLGKKFFAAQEYHAVLVTWNTFKKQKELDQYIVYINVETGFMDHLAFTNRGKGKALTGSAHYKDWKEIEPGFFLPSKISIDRGGLGGVPLHEMEFWNFELRFKADS